jgi:sulfofructose kinase
MAEVICIGSAVLEQIYDVPALANGNGALFAHGYRQAGAGTAANAAIAVARLGGNALLWTRLGDDETGDLIVADLLRYAVDTSGVHRVAGAQSPLSSVLAAADGRRQTTWFPGDGLPDDAGALTLGRIQDIGAVLADPLWPAGARTALAAAREHHRPGLLAVGTMPEPLAGALAGAAGYLVFTPGSLRRFSGEAEIEAGLAAAAAATDALVGVTEGADGFRWRRAGDDTPRSLPPVALPVVDPAGAWDAFCGALALALGEEKPFETAAGFALTVAGLTAAAPGGRRAMPDRRTAWHQFAASYPALSKSDA